MGIVRNAVFKGFVCYLIGSLLAYLSPIPYAYANPVGGNVSAGSATISTSGNTETITQKSQNAVIDWSAFNIGGKETTRFVDPNSSSLTVNRVHDMNPSQILGTLSANGNIVLINPNGVFFGQGSKVDVNGIIATTSDVKNSEVMAGGKIQFAPGGNPNASVENQGTITAKDAGLVGLVAPNVQNSGIITAKLGKVQLASGDSFTLDLYGDKLLEIRVSDAVKQQLVQNTGTIEAEGGTVKLTAAAGRSIVNSLIDVEGEIHAPTFQQHNGVISIYAEGNNAVQNNIAANKGKKQGSSTVTVSGLLDASGYNSGEKGGNISVLGDNVGIMQGAILDASGDQGGGNIKIGGDFHGAGTTPTALSTVVQNGAVINANAITSGNGGTVALWSDNYTNFLGLITARGGVQSGNGGFVETSGKQILNMQGLVDTSAPKGQAGTWLMDPEDVTISTGTDSDITGNPSFVPGGTQTTATLNVSDITTALNNGTNVTITTGGDAQSGPNGGSILVSNAISATTGASGSTGSLTLSSYKNITINGAITLGGTNTGPGGTAVTGGALTLDSANSGNNIGTISINANITTNGGNITMGGGSGTISAGTGYAYGGSTSGTQSGINNSAIINAGTGNIIANGYGGTYVGGSNSGIGGGTFKTSGSGNITLNGTGGAGNYSTNNYYGDDGVNTTVQTANGNIVINGTGGAGNSFAGAEYGVLGADTATGIGTINITGHGGTGTFGGGQDIGVTVTAQSNNGAITLIGTGGSAGVGVALIYILGEGASSTSGAISVTGTGTGGQIGVSIANAITTSGSITITAVSGGITTQNISETTIIGGPTNTNNITLTANTLSMGTGAAIQTTGNVAFQPYTASTSIGVVGAAGTLQITGTGGVLASTTAGSITIGNTADSGNTTVNANTWTTPLTLISGSGPITIAGAQSMGSNNLTLQTNGTLTVNANLSGTGTLTIEPASASTTVGVNGGSGTQGITNSDLGYIQSGFGGIVIGSASGTGNMDIDAYTWNAPVTFQSSTGNMIFESGTHSSGSHAFLADTGGNITLASGAAISSAASGNAIVLAAGGNFVNNSGSSSALSAGSGRWIVYSTKASSDTNGASVMDPAQTLYNETYASEAPGSVPNSSQDTWLYSTGLITITASGQTVTYGTAPNTSAVLGTTYSFSCSTGCSSSVVTGGPTLTISGGNGTSSSGNYNVGSWTITPSGVTVNNGDAISYVTGALTVNPATLTITGVTAGNKTYDTTTAATLNTGSAALSGKVTGDAVTLSTGSATGTFASANVANGIAVNTSGFSMSGADSGNYNLTQPSATANITPAGLTVTASNVSGTYGTSAANTLNGTSGFSSSGLLGGQTIGSVTSTVTVLSGRVC